MKRFSSLVLVAVFATAFAGHPAVHADGHAGHACLLSTTAPDVAGALPALSRPLPVFSGRLFAALPPSPRPEQPLARDARAPPL